jgi:hypothetical protein
VAGVQLTLAPGGKPLTAQVPLAATLGPLLVQVTVPVAVLPAAGFAGKPLTAAAMSACGVIATGSLSLLFDVFGSAVLVPALALMFSAPNVGALKVLVHVIDEPAASGFGAGLGVQLCVAPGGKPLKAHVGLAAALGPVLVQTPLTVTGWPAATVPGTVTVAVMSACGVTPCVACAVLLALFGSVVVVLAVPVTVTPPLGGAV